MKRHKRDIAIITSVFLILLIITRATFAFQFFTISSAATEPTFAINDHVFTSKLKSPKRLDFICFKVVVPDFGKQTWLLRLCGMPNDIIEIKNGILYVNSENIDRHLTLNHSYIISIKDTLNLNISESDMRHSNSPDSLIVYLSDIRVLSQKIPCRKDIMGPDEKDILIAQEFQKPWNQDHFGPIKVPEGKFFVLGDNRNNSIDSRHLGFIDKKDFLGTLLW